MSQFQSHSVSKLFFEAYQSYRNFPNVMQSCWRHLLQSQLIPPIRRQVDNRRPCQPEQFHLRPIMLRWIALSNNIRMLSHIAITPGSHSWHQRKLNASLSYHSSLIIPPLQVGKLRWSSLFADMWDASSLDATNPAITGWSFEWFGFGKGWIIFSLSFNCHPPAVDPPTMISIMV